MEYEEMVDGVIIGAGDCWAEQLSDDDDEGADVEVVLKRPEIPDPTLRCCRVSTFAEVDFFAFKKSMFILQTLDPALQVKCLSNEIENVYSTIMLWFEQSECKRNHRMEAAKNILKFRHEILCKLLLKSANIDIGKTDQRFCDIFPILSNRSPDYIKVEGLKVVILEFMVSSDVDKGKFIKGGGAFVSKYDNEINLLKGLDFVVSYYSVIIDGKDALNNTFVDDVKNCFADLGVLDYNLNKFNIIRKLFCKLHVETIKYLAPWYSLTFDDDIDLDVEIGDFKAYMVDKTLERNYLKHTVPLNVYNRILLNWSRISYLLEKQVGGEDILKYKLKYDIITNKFQFIQDRMGLDYQNWSITLNNYERFKLMKNVIFEQTVSKQTDIDYFELTTEVYHNVEQNFTLNYHAESYVPVESYEVFYYNEGEVYLPNSSVFCDENYDSYLIELFENLDVSTAEPKPFSSYSTNVNMFKLAVKEYDKSMEALNDMPGSMTVYQKPAFLFPLFDINQSNYCSYKDKNDVFLNGLLNFDLGNFTKVIIGRLTSPNVTFGTRLADIPNSILQLQNEINDANRNLTKYINENLKRKVTINVIRSEVEYTSLQTNLKNLNFQMSKQKEKVGFKGKVLPYLRFNNMSLYKNDFLNEMTHFKRKSERSILKGVGNVKYDLFNLYKATKIDMLTMANMRIQENILDENVGHDSLLLMKLKTMYIEDTQENLNIFKMLKLTHNLAFISRFCHSLFFHSQTSFNSKTVCFDNLGYPNVLLLVKGGKKIFRTKKSKLYRLIYPIASCNLQWFCDNNYMTSHQHIVLSGVDYLVTPWSYLDEVLLQEGLTYLYKIGGYLILNSLNKSIINVSDGYMINILLALHARRKTEVFMHNIRYLCMNSMSIISKIDEMLKELAGFNVDLFQAFIRQQISKNFVSFTSVLNNYSNTLGKKEPASYFAEQELKGLIDNDVIIKDIDSLASFVYSTFLMPKAPVNQQLEQAANIKGMLEIHDEFMSKVKPGVAKQVDNTTSVYGQTANEYWKALNANDFVIDPYVCTRVGNFMSDYLLSKLDKSEILSNWLRILNESWDEMANTKGLRGMTDDKFFGNKGYYIIYDKIMEDMNLQSFKNVFENDDLPDKDKLQLFEAFNQRVKDRLILNPIEQLNFHAVDKRQRGGGREIYVMDLNTKMYQQPLEKMFAFLCRNTTNEVISVPSDQRLMYIHTQVFEKPSFENENVYNLVLDCRKWAPKSVLLKYQIFVNSMSNILPTSFMKLFYHFFNLMYSKRIYTRSKVAEIYGKNEANKFMALGYLIEDKDKAGHYFEMPYSFVMGIFNYLSSLFHVANQMYASHIIRLTFERSKNSCYLNMLAHSDDSSGKLMCPDEGIMRQSFFIYQMLLKACNHLISDKKSCISATYYEFLSILYVNNELLSLLTKFIGNFTFKPTDKGLCADINDVYNKCIELFINGATFQQCYLAMKIQTSMIYRFYMNRKIELIDYELLPQIGGIPDAHPIMVVLAGTDAETIRVYTSYTNKSFHKQLLLTKYFNCDDKLDCFVKYITTDVKIERNKKITKHLQNLQLFDKDTRWIINNAELHNTGLNLNRYLLNLTKTDFCASLQDDTLTRRLSRSYYFRGHERIVTNDGHQFGYDVLKELTYCLLSEGDIFNNEWSSVIKLNVEEMLKDSSDIDMKIDILFSELIKLNSLFDRIDIDETNIKVSVKSCKPIHISLLKISTPILENFSPANLAIWLCKDKYKWLFKYGHSITESAIYMSDLLSNFKIDFKKDIDFTYRFLRKYKQKYLKNVYCYSNMPSNEREIVSYKDLLSLLSHNSFKNKHLPNLTAPYNKPLNLPIDLMLSDTFSEEFKQTSALICFLNSFANEKSLNILLSYKYSGFEWVCDSNEIQDIIDGLIIYWVDINIYRHYLMPHLKFIQLMINSNLNTPIFMNDAYFHCFTKRQVHVNNQWLGRGELFINLVDIKILFIINSLTIIEAFVNKLDYDFTIAQVSYINYTLINSGLSRLESHMQTVNYQYKNVQSFGISKKGVVNVGPPASQRICFPKFKFKNITHDLLNDLSTCQIRPLNNLQYLITTSDELNVKVFKVYTYDILTNDYYNHIRKILTNEENIIFCDIEQPLTEYVDLLLSDINQLPITVEKISLVENYNLTSLYNIVKAMSQREMLNFEKLKVRLKKYPAQEDGLLCLFLDYKSHDPSFKFKITKLYGPEYMNLKRMQPGIFMSELFSNFQSKYRALYSDIDRTMINKQLNKLVSHLEQDNEGNLMKALTTWGFVGVMGSLAEMDIKRNLNSFKMFKDSNKQEILQFNSRSFFDLIRILVKVYINHELYYLNDDFYKPVRSKNDLYLKITSLMAFISYNTCMKRTKNNLLTHSSIFDILAELIMPLFSNEEAIDALKDETENHDLFCTFEISKEVSQIWLTVCNCMAKSTWVFNSLNDIVPFKPESALRMSHNCIHVLKQWLKDLNIVKTFKYAPYAGFISKESIMYLTKAKSMYISGKYIVFEGKVVDLSSTVVNVNAKAYIRNALKEGDQFEDLMDEIGLELDSLEPDVDTLTEAFGNLDASEVYESKYNRQVKRTINGQLQNCHKYNYNLFFITQSVDFRTITKVRQTGETIVVMASKLIEKLTYVQNKYIAVFKPEEQSWVGESLINPVYIYIHVMDSDPINIGHWCQYLNATHLSTESIGEINLNSMWWSYNDEYGNNRKISTYASQTADEKLAELRALLDSENTPEIDETIITSRINECKIAIDELKKKYNLSDSFCEKYNKHLNVWDTFNKTKYNFDCIIESLDSLSKNISNLTTIMSTTEDILSKPKTMREHINISQVPSMFGVYNPTENIRTTILKDNILKAEIDTMFPGVLDDLITGNLFIKEQTLKGLSKFLRTALRGLNRYSPSFNGRVFWLKILCLIVNDATIATDTNNDAMWGSIIIQLSDIIDDDEDFDEDYSGVLSARAGGGRLKYKVDILKE